MRWPRVRFLLYLSLLTAVADVAHALDALHHHVNVAVSNPQHEPATEQHLERMQAPEQDVACDSDMVVCAGGEQLRRQPPSCGFPACPGVGANHMVRREAASRPQLPRAAIEDDDKMLVEVGSSSAKTNGSSLRGDGDDEPCSKDFFECEDGSVVAREPPSCAFAACPEAGVASTEEAEETQDEENTAGTEKPRQSHHDQQVQQEDRKEQDEGKDEATRAEGCERSQTNATSAASNATSMDDHSSASAANSSAVGTSNLFTPAGTTVTVLVTADPSWGLVRPGVAEGLVGTFPPLDLPLASTTEKPFAVSAELARAESDADGTMAGTVPTEEEAAGSLKLGTAAAAAAPAEASVEHTVPDEASVERTVPDAHAALHAASEMLHNEHRRIINSYEGTRIPEGSYPRAVASEQWPQEARREVAREHELEKKQEERLREVENEKFIENKLFVQISLIIIIVALGIAVGVFAANRSADKKGKKKRERGEKAARAMAPAEEEPWPTGAGEEWGEYYGEAGWEEGEQAWEQAWDDGSTWQGQQQPLAAAAWEPQQQQQQLSPGDSEGYAPQGPAGLQQ